MKFVRLWFTDVVGTLKSVAIAPAEAEGAFSEGIGFDGSAIEGLARVQESDLLAHPDPTTFQMLPWRGDVDPTARMFCDLRTPDGEPAAAVSAQRAQARAVEGGRRGLHVLHAPRDRVSTCSEPGHSRRGPRAPSTRPATSTTSRAAPPTIFRRRAVRMLEDLGISVEYSHHEGGPGQNEIDLRYADGLTMADNIMTFRTVVKEVAIEQGVHATFMPKPLADEPGSGMHTHVSLFEGDTNAFYDASAPHQLSVTGRRFIAGLLHHADEMSLVLNQFVNSYKRLWGGDEAPNHITWGHSNRSALVRVPRYKPGKGQSARIEHRGIDAAANPYLAYALMLSAGLKGIEEEYELPDEAEDNVWALSDAERRALGYRSLPRSLDNAIHRMEESELVAETLGEQVFQYVLANKRREFEQYRAQVTSVELKTTLDII